MQQDSEALNGLTPQDFVGSALFDSTFDEGMALVEETARYLDGRGARRLCHGRGPLNKNVAQPVSSDTARWSCITWTSSAAMHFSRVEFP